LTFSGAGDSGLAPCRRVPPRKSARGNGIRKQRTPARRGTTLALSAAAGFYAPPSGDNNMTIKIVPNEKGNPPGKLADAELHFTQGPLDGLKLIGFSVWERKTGNGRNVTFPARQYSVNGERRSFSLLRPLGDATSQDRLRDLILQAYAEYETANAVTS
jgi:hypothetical protein